MKFEKLSENTLKITLYCDELPIENDLDKFMSNSSKARDAFLGLLEKAEQEVGFSTKDCKIKIDAQALYNGNCVLTVTKLIKLKRTTNTVRPKKIMKNTVDKSDYSAYEFATFDDFCNFCQFLKTNKINNIRYLAKEVKLYKFRNSYFLVFYCFNSNYKKLPSFYSTITEFSKFYSSKELFYATLSERGNIIMDTNAIVTCQKHFSNN